jgi:hypothetical protein
VRSEEITDMLTVDQLLQSCVTAGATIIDIWPGLPPTFTSVGDVHVTPLPALTEEQARILCLSILVSAQEMQLEEDGEIDFDYITLDGERFTVNMVSGETGVSAVCMKVPNLARVMAGAKATLMANGDPPDDGDGLGGGADAEGGLGVRPRPKVPVLTGGAARPIPPDDALPPYFDS